MTPTRLLNTIVSEKVVERHGVAYGPLARHKLDVYQAAPSTAKPVVVLFFYGGAWREGERAIYRFVGSALAARGVTTVIADYRLYPDVVFPAFVDDAALAYAWTDRHLSDDGEIQIVLMGHSAGAHIAALLALDNSYLDAFAAGASRPAGFIGLAGPYAFDPTTWPTTRDIFAPAADNPDKARPAAFARGPAAPMLLLRGAEDKTVGAFNAHEMASALAAAGNDVRHIEYEGVGHVGLALALARPLRWRAPCLADSLAFIDHILETGRRGARVPPVSGA